VNKSAQARKFARSLIESLDKDADLDSVYSELTDMSEMLKGNAELLNFFMNPGIPGERKEKALEEIIEKAGASVITKSFLLILFRKRGIFLLPLITEQFLLFADLQCNRVRAEITVADSLDEKRKQANQRATFRGNGQGSRRECKRRPFHNRRSCDKDRKLGS